MLKIGEFSKLSHLTVKALRFYEKEGILAPVYIDTRTGYRFYEASQLEKASKIKAYRQLDLSIEEIRQICRGANEREVLLSKARMLEESREHIDFLLSSIKHIMEDKEMKYHVTEKIIPKALVYTAEAVLEKYGDIMTWIPSVAEECLKLNPDMKCAAVPYEFCEFPDGEFKERDILVRHNEAVAFAGKESDFISFREIPEAKVLSVFHKGSYDTINEAYSYITNYAEKNGFKIAGLARECYIDGIWNKESVDDWLTEVQLPVE